MIKQYYNLIMNVDSNGLSSLPNIVKFQLNITIVYVVIVFTLMVGSYLVLGPTLLLHVLFLIGIYFTSDVFKKVKSK